MKALVLDGETVTVVEDYAAVGEAHRAGKTFWMELDERSDEAERFLQRELQIHPLATEDVWNDLGLPKVEDYGEYVLVVLHGLRESDGHGQERPVELAELDMLIGKTFLVTHAREEKICAITPMQDEVQRNPKLLKKGPAWVAHAVMDRLVDAYLPLLDRFDEQIETVEECILADEASHRQEDRSLIPRILRIKRNLQVLRRTTIYQREILLRLSRAEFDEIPRDLVPFFRDVYDHFARVTELVDSYRELVASLLEAHLSMQSNRLNEVMKRLTIMSTIMLPLSVIAGIYGMNFEHMPELKWLYGYPYALGLMAAVALVIVGWFRAKKWF